MHGTGCWRNDSSKSKVARCAEADGRSGADAVNACEALGEQNQGGFVRGMPEMFGQRTASGFPQGMEPVFSFLLHALCGI